MSDDASVAWLATSNPRRPHCYVNLNRPRFDDRWNPRGLMRPHHAKGEAELGRSRSGESGMLAFVNLTWRSGGLTLCVDASPGDWIVSSVRPFKAHVVGSLLPPTFAAYARLFHPAMRDGLVVRWSEVAAANHRVCHAGMQWPSITGDRSFKNGGEQPGVWDEPPRTGSLPLDQTERLVTLLAAQTSTASQCWFAVWEGFGALAVPRDSTVGRLQMPQRQMILLTGPLAAAGASLEEDPFDQCASLWWPEDRSWCVATDVDLETTYVGGSRACVDSIVGDSQLEAMSIGVDQSLLWNSDHLNPRPTGGPE